MARAVAFVTALTVVIVVFCPDPGRKTTVTIHGPWSAAAPTGPESDAEGPGWNTGACLCV